MKENVSKIIDKTLKIYERTILNRTYGGYYKPQVQTTIIYNNIVFKNHCVYINNPKLRVKFNLKFESRNKNDIRDYYYKIFNSKTDNDKFVKSVLEKILDEEI